MSFLITHGQFVLLGQLVHTQDGNNVLERLVVLQDFLDGGRDVVVLLSDLYNEKKRISTCGNSRLFRAVRYEGPTCGI
jgi:hypothetical protein